MSSAPRRLQGKVAVVTASTAGIGLGIAERLGEEGASVVISSRKQANVDAAVESLRSKGVDASGLVCHVGSAVHRKELADFAVAKYGRIDIFVSNAAVNPTLGPILDLSEKELDKLLDTNLKATVLLIKEVVPHIPEGGNIIFVSSIAGFQPMPMLGMYSVTKTALLGLTKALAAELGPDIRVNCVAPGIVPTQFASYLVRDEAMRKEAEDRTLLGRLGMPSDIAGAVAFLASDDAAYVTGETIIVAGGMQSRL
eukprot:TRINITY_DN80237_c0_g1_i1.p1 TRINITY_DN80237_c0_g1~~TRINITY_DN80237_c0_g1_i1.p1  ORF type:complete len:254 (+),score=31.90 TRINITY_DN80237_c0_g1_i1:170-931(+)